jgi:hypothetical protein
VGGDGRNDGDMFSYRKLAALALVVAAAGIVIQIAGGHDYPVVPPGLVILVAAAGVVWFGSSRWVPLVAVVVGLFMVLGLFAADQAPRLVDPDTALDTIGLWIQLLAVAAAIGAGVLAFADARKNPADSRT